jgi:hypothetical protein
VCEEAAAILGWALRFRGIGAVERAGLYWGGEHVYVEADGWGLDPTREQFDGDLPLVFRPDPRPEPYDPQVDLRAARSEAELVDILAGFIAGTTRLVVFIDLAASESAIAAMLGAVSLDHLEPDVAAAARELQINHPATK